MCLNSGVPLRVLRRSVALISRTRLVEIVAALIGAM